MGAAGLQKTSTGEIKILDVHDFTEQGDILLEVGEAKQEGTESFIEHPDGFKLHNYDKLALKPADNEYLIGFLDEERFINSSVDDINNNYYIDEKFGLLVFNIEKDDKYIPVAFIDTDADGHIDDEKPIFDYAQSHETFQLRGRNTHQDKNLFTLALKIDMSQMIASLHFDDSGHGTHVAGIAAGYEIKGKKNFHGVAPGAQIISLKIGDNTLAGSASVSGSIRKAFIYGTRWALSHPDTPVIFNLSYGMGSEIAEQSDIERFLAALTKKYPQLVICVSSGNLGPGLSSVGKPGASEAVFTTAALLDKNSARDLYGANLKSHKLFFFSARGGEIAKPDVIAPGLAASSVPPFLKDDKLYGSSMASPQTAGAAALLLSAFQQHDSTARPQANQLYRAFRYGAQPLAEYTFLDQGAGILNIPQAWKILKKLINKKNNRTLVGYNISTESPIFPSRKGKTAYWRMGGYYPQDAAAQSFQIQPVFPEEFSADQISDFYQAFNLKSTTNWLQTDKKSTYIRGENSAIVQVNYQSKPKLKPGLYTGKIIAYKKHTSAQPEDIEFELLNTVIIPYKFHSENNYQQKLTKQQLQPGDYQRYFLHIPPGASAVHLEFYAQQNKHCAAYPVIFDPAGRRYALLEKVTGKNRKRISKVITEEDLLAGTWEVVVYIPFTEKKRSHFNFEAYCTGLKADPEILSEFSYPAGKTPEGKFEVTNLFSTPISSTAQGIIAGYKRTFERTLSNGNTTFRYRFRVAADIGKVVFKVELPVESFRKFTNISVNIKNQEGEYLVQDGMTYAKRSILFTNAKKGNYRLEIQGAKTKLNESISWAFKLTEYFYFSKAHRIALSVKEQDNNEFTLYPQMATKLNFTFAETPPVAPDRFSLFGLIMFKKKDTGEIWATVELDFNTGLR